MSLDLVFRNETKAPEGASYPEAFFRSWIERTLQLAPSHSEVVEVSVTLLDPGQMQDLNKRYRNKDAPTDVLSFPLGEISLPGYTVNTIGDLFICPQYAAHKAEGEGISLDDKMSWLVVHGVLHLLGYDHERSTKEAAEMGRLEKQILGS